MIMLLCLLCCINDDWLMSFGMSAWIKDIVKIGIVILIIIFVVLVMGPCITGCFSFQIRKIDDSVFDKRGGDVAGVLGALTLQPVYCKIP